METFITQFWSLIDAMIVPVVGIASTYLYGWIKEHAIPWFDELGANWQRLLVVFQTWALGALGGWVNVALPDNLAVLDLSHVESVVAAIFALGATAAE